MKKLLMVGRKERTMISNVHPDEQEETFLPNFSADNSAMIVSIEGNREDAAPYVTNPCVTTSFAHKPISYIESTRGGSLDSLDSYEQRQIAKSEYSKDMDFRRNIFGAVIKEELKEKAAAKKRLLKLQDEHNVSAIILDSNHMPCLETTLPGGEKILSQPITNARNLRMMLLYGSEQVYGPMVAHILCDDNEEGIMVNYEDLTAKSLSRALSRMGISLRGSRHNLSLIKELLLSYLFEHAETKEIPDNIGWTKNSMSKWIFTKEGELNMMEVRHDG